MNKQRLEQTVLAIYTASIIGDPKDTPSPGAIVEEAGMLLAEIDDYYGKLVAE